MDGPTGSPETTAHSFSLSRELAADNDVEGFKRSVCLESEVAEVGIWYGRDGLSRKMILEHRTPLMVAAAMYGSADFGKLILLLPDVDVNFSSAALIRPLPFIVLLLVDLLMVSMLSRCCYSLVLILTVIDANGHRPADVIVLPPNSPYSRVDFEELLRNGCSACRRDMQASIDSLSSRSMPLSVIRRMSAAIFT